MKSIEAKIREIAETFLFEENIWKVRSAICERIRGRLHGFKITTWDDKPIDEGIVPHTVQKVECLDLTEPEDINDNLVLLQVDLYLDVASESPVSVKVSIGPDDGIGDRITIIRPDISPPGDF